MNLILFRRLPVQLALLVIIALAFAQIISLWLFVDERSLAVRATLGFEAVGRAANVARLIYEAPKELHESVLRAASSPLVRFEVSEKSGVEIHENVDAELVEPRIRTLLGKDYEGEIRVQLRQIEGQLVPMQHMESEMTEIHMAMMHGQLSAVEMKLAIELSKQRWLNVGTRFEQPPLQWPIYSMFAFILTAAIILAAVFWFLMTRLTGPLQKLVKAADKLGRGEELTKLPEAGPTELRELTEAFNRMQDRLTRFVSDRTRLLASLGHDLRSPLTALRVRSEMVEDDETRESIVNSIEEMQTMVESTLTFAHGMTANESSKTVEIGHLLRELQNELNIKPTMVVFVENNPEIYARLKPTALKRAIRNLLENAIRYGNSAHVKTSAEHGEISIIVEDEGPGIPPSQIEQVFDPFYRIEKSRSLETGGHGLGLSIARTIVRAQGGDIKLQNKPSGGLRTIVLLPYDGPRQSK